MEVAVDWKEVWDAEDGGRRGREDTENRGARRTGGRGGWGDAKDMGTLRTEGTRGDAENGWDTGALTQETRRTGRWIGHELQLTKIF